MNNKKQLSKNSTMSLRVQKMAQLLFSLIICLGIIAIIEFVLFFFSKDKDLSGISSWLLGINFTFAVFSINFTFFGYQLSRYKSILEHMAKRQWFNIIILLALPFVPLLIYILSREYFALSAILVLPIVVWASIGNALLTQHFLNPHAYLKNKITESKIKKYLSDIYNTVEIEVSNHKKYISNVNKFQIPAHEWSFETDVIGLRKHDLWDSIAMVLKSSIKNNDHPVYQVALDYAYLLLLETYSFESRKEDDYRELRALYMVSSNRFRGLTHWILENDPEGIYIQAYANRLCAFLKTPDALNDFLGELVKGIMSDITFIGSSMLSDPRLPDPIKILNTIHAVMELSIHKIDEEEKAGKDRFLDRYNIAGYANLILTLGEKAIATKRIRFVYRCMETLSYLGCNSAKINSRQSVVACFEALVQLGRICRKEKIGCFWNRCIIPLHLHAEEFMGHILTWLIKDLKKDGSFTLKSCAEQAYSRLRGFKCKIIPKSNLNPKFWIEEIKDNNGNLIPHIESLSGMYGYDGKVDYSNYDDLTEYNLLDLD